MPDPYPAMHPGVPGGERRQPNPGRDYVESTEEMLTALPVDFHLLTAALSCSRQPDISGAGGKPASKPPINLAIDALRTDLVYTTAIWEEIIREHCRLSPRRNGTVREEQSLIQSVSILAPRTDVFLALPPIDGYFDGVECGLVRRDGLAGARRLHRLHEAVSCTLGLGAVTIRLPGLCPGCAGQLLRRDAGSESVYCAGCAGRWTYDDYRRYVGFMIQ